MGWVKQCKPTVLFMLPAIVLFLSGCTVKAIGDPKRPITIDAHITLDIKGLKDTATNIEDFVSSGKPVENLPAKSK